MNLDVLKNFVEIVNSRTISDAAQTLKISQSQLSRRLKILEKEIGMPLLSRRSSRGIELTERGQEFYVMCQQVIGKLEKQTALIKQRGSEPHGLLKIEAGIGNTQEILENLPSFSAKFPEIQFKFLSTTNVFQIKMDNVDISITATKLLEPHLVQRHLVDTFLRLYAAPDYFSHYPKPKTLEDLKSHKLIVYGAHNQEFLRFYNIHSKKETGNWQPFIEVNNGFALQNAILKGLGIGPCNYSEEFVKKNLLIDVLPDMKSLILPYYFTYHRRLEGSPKVEAFYDFMKDLTKSWGSPKDPGGTGTGR